jgi:ABC-type lipoprotein export system ATPase subunit
MLSCGDLCKSYPVSGGAVDAVRGVDLDLAQGEFMAIIGRSGSGKSSLIAMIGGLSRPDRGRVRMDGVDIWSLGEDKLARLRNSAIGYIFQFPSLLPTLNAVDNVALPALLGRRASRPAAYDRAKALLDSVGLAAHLDAYPAEMSAGEQRRAALARALINAPRLLLADEPTADLDEQTEREIMAELLRINRAGVALVLVTHNLALAAGAGRIVQIADGAVVS